MLKKIISRTALVGGLLLAPIQGKAAEPFAFFDVGSSIIAEPNLLKLKHAPEEIRNVSVHKDDRWAEYGRGPIEDKSIQYPWGSWNLEASVGTGIETEKADFRIGVGARYPIVNWENDIKKRNYTNAPGTGQRGEGAALTYYGFKEDKISGIDEIIPRAFARISSKSGPFLEYSVELQDINMRTGYDRYDRLTSGEPQRLTTLTKHSIKLGMGNEKFSAYAGYVFSNRNDSPLGKQCEIETANHFIVGFQLQFGGKTN